MPDKVAPRLHPNLLGCAQILTIALCAAACEGAAVGGFPLDAGEDGRADALEASLQDALDDGVDGQSMGPGPYGALPSGYCCESDQDCRRRMCMDFDGVKMCSDNCRFDSLCLASPEMRCDTVLEQCVPVGKPSCISATQWVLGTKSTGDCCVGDGAECRGGLCWSFQEDENPFMCTQACDEDDCPPGFSCYSYDRACYPDDPTRCN